MAYGDNDSDRAHKTGRIVILSILILFLAGGYLIMKVGACTHELEVCREEFFEVKSDNNNSHICSPGAIVEMVNSPPAPRAGIVCHCPGNIAPDAASTTK